MFYLTTVILPIVIILTPIIYDEISDLLYLLLKE